MDPVDAPEAVWHAKSPEQALTAFNATPGGLSSADAEHRLAQYGENRLPAPRKRGPLRRFMSQFNNILIQVLLAAALVTALLGHWLDTGVILGVVLINALIGFVQEGKAERALEAIRALLSPQASVMRDGHRQQIPAEKVVPGDIVYIQSGDKVPAGLRLLHTKSLRIDESALTGESVPVEKSVEAVASDAALGDRFCLAHSGTVVTYGTGTGIVVATGARTELGRISAMIGEVQTLTTPLLRQMDGFGRWLTGGILLLAAATFLFGVSVRSYTTAEMFLSVVGLAVAAIPEGLPAIMTITLAIGVQRMARRNAIIRRLPAVETLGSVSVICTDKTGTLTRNEMMVASIATADALYTVNGAGYEPRGEFLEGSRTVSSEDIPVLVELARSALLCNDASLQLQEEVWTLDGDPTEGALLTLAMKAGLDPDFEKKEWPRLDVIPFESEHRFMATLHHDHAGHRFVYLKGAPEQVIGRCHRERRDGEDRPIDVDFWRAQMDALAREGQRILAVCFKDMPPEQSELDFSDVENGFVLLGVFGMIDPPREEAAAAVRECRSAGIRVKMITGDHAVTARAIASRMGLAEGDPLTGDKLERMDDAEFAAAARDTDVFARTSPEHKLRLVTALQASGEVVAMTGDGVNDAPALKRADVGVAMGLKGTEAAKQAAEMVLADDNFASIAHAVEEGRTVYDNLRKAILFILPTNGGEAAVIIAAIGLGFTLPMTPVQILWVNMVTAVSLALALAFEPAERNVMLRPPRRADEPLLSPFLLWRIVMVSALLVAGVLGLFLWEHGRSGNLDVARTVAVNALVMGEIFYLFNSRFIESSVLTVRAFVGNRYVLAAIAVLVVLQLMFTYTAPFQFLFGTAAIGWEEWGLIFVFGALLFLIVETEKAVWRWLHRAGRRPPARRTV